MVPPPSKRGARAAAAIQAALLLLVLTPLASWLLSGGKQAVQCRLQQQHDADAMMALRPRGKVYLRYDVQFGLCNQLNSHVNALMLAHALGVDAVLVPPAWSRNPGDFNHSKFDQQWVKNNPASTLLDLESMAAAWAQRGIQLVEESAQLQKPELQGCIRTRAVEEQLQQSMPDAMKTCQGCSKLYLQAPLARLLAQARANIDAVWAQHGPSTCVMLDGGNLFWAGNLVTSANLAASAAASLRFPPHIEAIADKVANSIGPVFNGVHLRVEPDMGLDPKDIVPKYLALMRELGFNATTPLYVASALLTYDDSAGFGRMASLLQKEGLCSRAVAKEHLLPAAELAGLNSEQVAMVDLLVLARTERFVGHVASTFSFVAHDLRVIRLDANPATGRLIDFPADQHHPGNSFLPAEVMAGS